MNRPFASEPAVSIAARLRLSPGVLLRPGEELQVAAPLDGTLTIQQRAADGFRTILQQAIRGGESVACVFGEPGMYLARLESPAGHFQHPFAVVAAGWAVCQLTVNCNTGEDVADIIHPAGVAADYYVRLPRPGMGLDYSAADPRWIAHERTCADVIHPHVMAGDLGIIDPQWHHDNPNWSSLPRERISAMLRALREWWSALGYEHLDRLSSYTPCNDLISVLGENGFRVLHSLVPEQNWSDGEWVINHWGMPNCPFWISPEEFRKPSSRGHNSVLGMTLSAYHVWNAHFTNWGDYALSPSHFTRWIRAADAGERPVRFINFLQDTLAGWRSLSDDPFFFTAAFEFGRSFGTQQMTSFNRQGLRAFLDLAKLEKVVFSTSREVRAYYDRHQEQIPASVYRQRDHWFGVTINSKPAAVGDTLCVEGPSYKAALIEGDFLPGFYYDYGTRWNFASDDPAAPDDRAKIIRERVTVRHDTDRGTLTIKIVEPLPHPVPLGVWDASEIDGPFPIHFLPTLEDGRPAALLEIPADWCGEVVVGLTGRRPSGRDPFESPAAPCKLRSFGQNGSTHTYLSLDVPLLAEASLEVDLRRSAVVEDARGDSRSLDAGRQRLSFGPFAGWHRFAGCETSDVIPVRDSAKAILQSAAVLSADWQGQLSAHRDALRAAALALGGGDAPRLQVLCGANLPVGTRGRAKPWDLVERTGGLDAAEYGDGVLSVGPGKSFWYHPRSLVFKLRGLIDPCQGEHFVLLNSFSVLGGQTRYKVFLDEEEVAHWELPDTALHEKAWLRLPLPHNRPLVEVRLTADQTPVLDHWWRDGGFVAALHALWVFRRG